MAQPCQHVPSAQFAAAVGKRPPFRWRPRPPPLPSLLLAPCSWASALPASTCLRGLPGGHQLLQSCPEAHTLWTWEPASGWQRAGALGRPGASLAVSWPSGAARGTVPLSFSRFTYIHAYSFVPNETLQHQQHCKKSRRAHVFLAGAVLTPGQGPQGLFPLDLHGGLHSEGPPQEGPSALHAAGSTLPLLHLANPYAPCRTHSPSAPVQRVPTGQNTQQGRQCLRARAWVQIPGLRLAGHVTLRPRCWQWDAHPCGHRSSWGRLWLGLSGYSLAHQPSALGTVTTQPSRGTFHKHQLLSCFHGHRMPALQTPTGAGHCP